MAISPRSRAALSPRWIGATLLVAAALIAVQTVAIARTAIAGQALLVERKLAQTLNMAGAVIADSRERVASMARGWAIWDPVAAYVAAPDSGFLLTHVTTETMLSMQLNFVGAVDADGDVVLSRGFDPDERSWVPFPDELQPLLRAARSRATTRLVETPLGVAVVATVPIRAPESPSSNEILGAVLMGAVIDTAALTAVGAGERTAVDLLAASDRSLPRTLPSAGQPRIESSSQQNLWMGYVAIPDEAFVIRAARTAPVRFTLADLLTSPILWTSIALTLLCVAAWHWFALRAALAARESTLAARPADLPAAAPPPVAATAPLHAPAVPTPVVAKSLAQAPLAADVLTEPRHLPVAEPTLSLRPHAPASNPHAMGLRVLLVEDNAVNREVALGMLESAGCRTRVAVDGAEALEVLAQDRRFDAVLMDCRMPVMDGYEATRLLRERESAQNLQPLHVIALTANALVDDRTRCFAAGMNDFVSKPYTMEQLLDAISRAAPRPDGASADPASAASEPQEPVAGDLPPELSEASLKRIAAVGQPDLLPRLVGVFDAESEKLLERLSTSLAASDLEPATRAVHSLKSSSAVLGGLRLSGTARMCEQLLRAGDMLSAGNLLEQLRSERSELVAALRRYTDRRAA